MANETVVRSDSKPTTETMDAAVKVKWLQALRSGRYKQAQSVLKDANGCHCCLGVLADIINPAGWSTELVVSEEADQQCYLYDAEDTMLQSKFLHKLGISTDHAVNLADLNDSGNSFNAIADFIEANL